MKPIAEMSRIELGSLICSKLMEKGLEVVLSGGSCVAIYSNEKYVSQDLDLVNRYESNRKSIEGVMTSLGFQKQSTLARLYFHQDTEFYVEFPTGPLAIGEERINKIHNIKTDVGVLNILTPTDCIKDRLVYYFHNNEKQGLKLASLVATSGHEIDFDDLRRWAKDENCAEKFQDFWKEIEKFKD